MDTHDSGQPRNDITPPGAQPAEGQDNLPDASWLARNGPFLVAFLGLIFYLVYRGWELEDFAALAKTVLGLGLVIFIHELGHFALAKWCGVRVITFSLGFGPALPGCSFVWGETLYKIAILPIGGYVNMLGEGNEGEEGDVDPRSYKNKKVWQRMLIISAGVIMNVVLALCCFVFVYTTRGAERIPALIDKVDPGSPLWKVDAGPDSESHRGVHRGDDIRAIGKRTAEPPFPFVWFDHDLQPTVMLSSAGDKLRFVFSAPTAPERQWVDTTIEPRLNTEEGDEKPVIGLAPASELRFWSRRAAKVRSAPVVYGSPADLPNGFDFDDEIIATTDPSTPDKPDNVTELALDPTDATRHDYFDFQRRLRALAGKPMVIRVRRATSGDPEDPNATFTTADITVRPAYRYVLGIRMTMGPVTAVRYPASKHGILPDDVIVAVQVKDGPKTIRWVTTRSAKPSAEERDLDPDRLPFELSQWAARQPTGEARNLTFSLLRKNQPPKREEETNVEAVVPWDESWAGNAEYPLNFSSPLSLSCLGIAYRVKTTVKGVEPKSAAAAAEVEEPTHFAYRDGDRIRIYVRQGDIVRRGGKEQTLPVGETYPLEPGDEVTHAGDTFTLAKDNTVSLEKGDVVNLREDDLITEVRQYEIEYDRKTQEKKQKASKWIEIQEFQWAYVASTLQGFDTPRVGFKVKRGNVLHVSLQATPDETWPVDGRGLLLTVDSRLQKAKDFGEACVMGVDTTRSFIMQIYASLRSLAKGRVSFKQFVGPIGIGAAAFSLAGSNIYQFILFLGIISVNLAVVNFLPIPVLDGGHMVFLCYEFIRGRPASQRLREFAAYVGLAFIVCLMLFVIFLDVKRFI